MVRKFLAEFELYVMLAVSRLGDEAYGAAVQREIEQRSGRPVSIGAVYATLGRLGDKGYMTFRISEPTPVPGGRSRKFCTLSPAGDEALRRSTRMLGRMMEGMDLAEEGGGTP